MMIHFGGSKTHECKDCGSRLIENQQCLTCDSSNIQDIQVGLFINYDEPQDLDVKIDVVMPALSKLYKQTEIDGDVVHLVPVKDLEKLNTLIDGYNETHDTNLDYELIKI